MSDQLVRIGDQEFLVRLHRDGDGWRGEIGGSSTHLLKLQMLNDRQAELTVDGERQVVWFAIVGDTLHFHLDGAAHSAEVSLASAPKRVRHSEHSMTAPMPGLILKIFVSPGEVVSKGDSLLVLEAMKMEHQIAAPHDGVVEAVHCSVGQLVQSGVELISLEEKSQS